MSSEFPRLQKKLDELRWKFEQELQVAIDEYGVEDVELKISEANFISRSPISKVAYSLRKKLDECFQPPKTVEPTDAHMTREEVINLFQLAKTGLATIYKSRITKEHISSAQALIKIGRYQETAIRVLTEALLIAETDITTTEHKQKEAKKIRKLASEALSECGSEIAMFDANNKSTNYSMEIGIFDGQCIKINATNEKKYCEVDKNGKATCPDGTTYSLTEWTASSC